MNIKSFAYCDIRGIAGIVEISIYHDIRYLECELLKHEANIFHSLVPLATFTLLFQCFGKVVSIGQQSFVECLSKLASWLCINTLSAVVFAINHIGTVFI